MTKENTARNTRIKAERHAKRMQTQMQKRKFDHVFGVYDGDLAVPRGTARALRRAHLTTNWQKRQAKAAADAAKAAEAT